MLAKKLDSHLTMGGEQDRFTARFWGVRGSIPAPGPQTVRYGGNTSCIEVWCDDTLFVLDAGSGLRELGLSLNTLPGPVEGHIFLSHLHWDHIQGMPFFSTAYAPGNAFHIYGSRREGVSLSDNLVGQMTHPNFPVPLSVMQSSISFHEIEAGAEMVIGGARVVTAPLNHPGGSMGVRIEHRGRAIAYCSDHEHEEHRRIHPGVDRLARDADLLIYDATYTDAEYPARKGWGHSTWQVACDISVDLGVKRLGIFHHDPSHVDDMLDEIGSQAAARNECAFICREGLEIDLLGD